MYDLVVRRFAGASVILTTNKSLLDWHDVVDDRVLTKATLDRLLQH